MTFPLTRLFNLATGRHGYAGINEDDSEAGVVREGDREDEAELRQTKAVGISIRNITKKYRDGDRAALSTVSLDLYEGQIFGLLGHNGAGKTTLHSIITGLLQPSTGQIFVEGKDLSDEKVGDVCILGRCLNSCRPNVIRLPLPFQLTFVSYLLSRRGMTYGRPSAFVPSTISCMIGLRFMSTSSCLPPSKVRTPSDLLRQAKLA
jgi:energy-coupling factor transporter ATP-binding protein EcfA2